MKLPVAKKTNKNRNEKAQQIYVKLPSQYHHDPASQIKESFSFSQNQTMPKKRKSKKTLDSMSNPNPNPNYGNHEQLMEDDEAAPSLDIPVSSPRSRRPLAKSKKKPIPKKKLAMIHEKLSLLSKNLHPVPFLPNPKTLAEISHHEPLFRSLGLWDFSRLDFDQILRTDLLADLIAHYDPYAHCSRVRGARINVSRAHLARSLSLPVKKDRISAAAESEIIVLDAEAEGAILRFLSNSAVFLEDAAELPGEVVSANQMVREGHPERVDWAGLLWVMVEKELLETPMAGVCYYASHLQRLMRFQKPKLFAEEEEQEVDPEPEEEEVEVEVPEEDNGGVEVEDEDLSRREENMEVVGMEEDGFEGFSSLGRLNSMDLMQAAIGGHGSISYNMEPANGEFVGMGSDVHESMELDPGPGSSIMFDRKRAMDDEDGNGGNQEKKFRSYSPWENTPDVLAYEEITGHVQSWMGNGKMLLVEKEKALMNYQLQLQFLRGAVQQKDNVIGSAERVFLQEQQKRQFEACRMEHELRTLRNVVYDYRKALKDTRFKFAEYKHKFPLEVEPVCKDVGAETEGGVFGTEGPQEPCLVKKEEVHEIALKMINDFNKSWSGKFNDHCTRLSSSLERLVSLREELKLLKERAAEAKEQTMMETTA